MDKATSGWINGFIGVAIFAGSLPATRVAVAELDPIFLTCARAAIAAVLGWTLLWLLRQPRPGRAQLPALALTALGVVLGFPLLTALALQHVTSAHSIVFLGCCRCPPPFSRYCAAVNARGRRSGCSRWRARPSWSATP